ncbi:hypothetical protein RMR21_018155 [Agrobacterium sp. rho-8.1]
MIAYDIEMLPRPADRGPDCHGWVFGLPPGITPERWPLDPNNGYPLMHGFTLLLPEDYRVHGLEIVALSFFATAPDHCDGAFFEVKSARAKVEAIQGHPRLHRMQDILGCEYALILLTQAEFDGPLCQPPGSQIETDRKPNWMTLGAAASHWKMIGLDETVQDNYLKRILGEKPPRDVMYNRAIRWIPRKSDLNAGVPPREDWENDNSGYQSYFYWAEDPVEIATDTEEGRQRVQDAFRIHDWAKDHKDAHIGGTMRPAQNIPAFSPYYIEFDEYFGGYNFGGGNAQLDFCDMKFDWACG